MSFGSTATLARSLDRLVLDHERRAPGAELGDLVRRAGVIRAEADVLNLPALAGVAALREGELLLAAGDPAGALSALESSLPRLEQAGSTDLVAVALARCSEALVATGELRRALAVCARGIALVERDRDKTSAAYMQASYLRRTISLYANGVLAAHALGDDRMLGWTELAKGRAPQLARPGGERELRERLAQLGDRIDTCRARGDDDGELALRRRRRVLFDRLLGLARPDSRPRFDVHAVQRALAPAQRALSYFWIDRTRLLIAVVSPAEVRTALQRVAPEQRESLDRLAEHVTGLAARGGAVELGVRGTLVDRAVGRISGLLLPEPVREALRGAERLLVSPHRILHAIPLLALHFDGEPLVRLMAVASIPSLGCLQHGAGLTPARRIVSVGVDEFHVGGVAAGPLPGAQDAASEIAARYAAGGYAADRLLGEEAREDALRELLADPTAAPACLHLTLHGASVESDTPLESWLLLARSRLDGLDLLDWRLAGTTVVLAACSSGQRAIRGRGMAELPGDDLLGLQAAFFAAGARQVLGALWPVDLDVARGLTRRFHDALLAGHPADVALRHAVLDHLATAAVRDRGVEHWAPFTLTAIGQPRSIGRRER